MSFGLVESIPLRSASVRWISLSFSVGRWCGDEYLWSAREER